MYCSPRSRGLVDYEDDEDDEDYRPPPRKHTEATEQDGGTMESLRLKRKLGLKEKESEISKKQRLVKNSKSRDGGVFAALCSTLSQAVLPNKKVGNSMDASSPTSGDIKGACRDSNDEKGSGYSLRDCEQKSCSAEENRRERGGVESCASRSRSDCLHSPQESRQLSGEECSLIPPKSSPEMAVNGS